jgi:hypothetical protein
MFKVMVMVLQRNGYGVALSTGRPFISRYCVSVACVCVCVCVCLLCGEYVFCALVCYVSLQVISINIG